jgi:ABC-type glycerol-3-phosphate transport system substrate-binding protein
MEERKMKKALVLVCTALIMLSMMGCPEDQGIVIWSFTDEVEGLVMNYYTKAFPDVKISYSFTPTDQFENRLDPVLRTGRGAPDVFALEASFVRKYVESGLLLDITDVYEKNRNKLLAYTAEIGTYEGRVYGMSWQACPGAFFYRRSIANKYFGNDDPAYIQTLVSDFDKFSATAEKLRADSNGQAVILASRGDLFNVFVDGRSRPWIVNGRLVIDPVMETYMRMSKEFHEKGYDGKVGQWGDGWFAAMRDEHFDANGRRYEAFGYFLPTWGLHYVLKPNAEATSGDWAMVEGPAAYRWGGTWLGAWKGTKKVNEVKHMIEWITTDDAFLEEYALASGDVVSNINVMNKIAPTFSEPFLKGQNHYAAFAAMAQNVDGKLLQGTDQSINGIFAEAVNAYVLGEMTFEEAIADFRNQVQTQLNFN